MEIPPTECLQCGARLPDFQYAHCKQCREAWLKESERNGLDALEKLANAAKVENCKSSAHFSNMKAQFYEAAHEAVPQLIARVRELKQELAISEEAYRVLGGTEEMIRKHHIEQVRELKAELEVSDKLLAERNRVLDVFPCPIHGQCVPHAIEQIRELKAIMQGHHDGCNYLAPPIIYCNKCGFVGSRVISSKNKAP